MRVDNSVAVLGKKWSVVTCLCSIASVNWSARGYDLIGLVDGDVLEDDRSRLLPKEEHWEPIG